MEISEMSKEDFGLFWPTFKSVVEAQETYAFEPDIGYEEGFNLWCASPQLTLVAKENGEVLGSYYIKANAAGPSSHICNCGYMVAPQARGKGLAKVLCEHSQKIALELGYTAMQFNSVVSSNQIAIRIWQSLGYAIIGTIPDAYKHKQLGLVDSYIMYKRLKP